VFRARLNVPGYQQFRDARLGLPVIGVSQKTPRCGEHFSSKVVLYMSDYKAAHTLSGNAVIKNNKTGCFCEGS
jgi:hypothetical protein